MQVAVEAHAVAPGHPLPPHWPYSDWVEVLPPPALVVVERVVARLVVVVVWDVVIVVVMVVLVVEAVVVGLESIPVVAVPLAVIAEVAWLIDTAPLYRVGPGTIYVESEL